MNDKNPRLRHVLQDDIRHGDLWRTLRRDWRELKAFFLTEERQRRLAEMRWLKRCWYLFWWLLKTLFLKLTPLRRILTLLALALILTSGSVTYEDGRVQGRNDWHFLGSILILFVLMLELKDKLLAQSELQAGRTVQRALLPETGPDVPGWDVWLFSRPANEVGGDLIDFLQIDKECYGLALGDVSGKGLAAALFMAKLQATLRALAPDFDSLAGLVRKINQIFYRDTLASSFASLIYLEVRANAGRVRLVNAGHLPPVLVKNGSPSELPKGEQALGLASDVRYVEHVIELDAGHLFIAYSDGITEACNAQGQFFGEQRLMTLLQNLAGLSSREIGERILAEVNGFVGEAHTHDDLSLIILKRRG